MRVQFGLFSAETQFIRGIWTHQNQVYKDQLVRLFLDLPDIHENYQFFKKYQETLKERFQQLEVYVTTFLVEVV